MDVDSLYYMLERFLEFEGLYDTNITLIKEFNGVLVQILSQEGDEFYPQIKLETPFSDLINTKVESDFVNGSMIEKQLCQPLQTDDMIHCEIEVESLRVKISNPPNNVESSKYLLSVEQDSMIKDGNQPDNLTRTEENIPRNGYILNYNEIHDESYENEIDIAKDGNQPDNLARTKENITRNDNILNNNEVLDESYENEIVIAKGQTPSQQFSCKNCSLQFKTKTAYKKHRSNVHYKQIWRCQKCKMIVKMNGKTRAKVRDDHSREFHQDDVTCKLCGKIFHNKQNLKVHGKYAHRIGLKDETPFVCAYCPYTTAQYANLKVHMTSIHSGQTYRCSEESCSYATASWPCFRRHRRLHKVKVENKITKSYSCLICGIKLSRKSHLRRHHLNIHEHTRYNCNFCDKSFGCELNMNRHVKAIHEGERFHCDSCTSSYSHKTDLNRHIKKCHPDK